MDLEIIIKHMTPWKISYIIYNRSCQTKLIQTKPNQTKPNQTKPNQAKPNQTKPNQLNQTKLNQTKLKQTKLCQTIFMIKGYNEQTDCINMQWQIFHTIIDISYNNRYFIQ